MLLLLPGAFAAVSSFNSSLAAASAESQAKADTLFADPTLLIDEVRKQLAAAREDSSRLLADQKVRAPAGGMASAALEARQFYLEMLIHIYAAQLERLDELSALQQRNADADAEKDAENLAPSESSSPMPFLTADGLRDSMAGLDRRIAGLEKLHAMMEPNIQRLIAVNKGSGAKLRQANEALENSRENSAVLAILVDKRDILALQNRIEAARLVNVEIEKKIITEKLLDLRRQREAVSARTGQAVAYEQITPQEIAVMRKTLDEQRQAVMVELNAMLADNNAEKQHEKTQSGLPETVANVPSTPHAGDLLLQARSENAGLKLQTLYFILEILQAQQFFWELRASYANIFDREKAREAYAQIAKGYNNLRAVREYVKQLREISLDLLSARVNINGDIQVSKSAGQDEALQSVYLERLILLSRVLNVLESTENLINRWQQDLDRRFRIKTIVDRLEEFWLNLRDVGSGIWHYEISAAQDVIDIDGRKINIQRSITVAKLMTALMILLFGYWLATKLAFLAARIAMKRFGTDASWARIGRRWFLFVTVFILLLVSLTVVHIPLTVFAFMGGAVAIGAGFGMQNLLKNLISGLMLLLERPFRPGDLVEVGDIRGRITDIGVRSSHIRDNNGIETLIPNSTFIEEKVTNWTLSSQAVRIAVKVGVAYGAPEQEVTDLLLQAAERHGLVLNSPAPRVLFEDFGDNALLFGLYVWIELKPDVDWRIIASDLRYIINKSFAAKGISIAFPQRDVHLDIARPFEVRVVPIE